MEGEEKKSEGEMNPSERPDASGWTPELYARRKARAKAMAWVLVAMIALFFLVTVVKLGGNIAERSI